MKILLVGDIENAFLDTPNFQETSCRACDGICQAVELAAEEHYDVISVVIPVQQSGFITALQALRKKNKKARIILLSQMHQEPLAINITSVSKVADDYLICPLTSGSFYYFIEGGTVTADSAIKPAAADNETTERIKELERLATEDDLTGLKNRRYIWEFARQMIERAKNQNGRVTLLIFDIDNFKHYNDMYGHLAGDEILKQAASLMQQCCRTHDVVGRIGGDEFAVVFWDEPKQKSTESQQERRSSSEHPREAIFIAERFREQLGKNHTDLLGPSGQGTLTISGGLASFPRDSSNAEALFGKADQALLEAKRSGKNRIYLVGTPNRAAAKED
ncbi:MAG: diguanylate cyclase [Phycisphaerae bacterium]